MSKLNFCTDWGYVWVITPKDIVNIDTAPLQSWYLKKKKTNQNKRTKKTGVTGEVVTPQRQDQVCSSPLAVLLIQLRTAGLLNLKIE